MGDLRTICIRILGVSTALALCFFSTQARAQDGFVDNYTACEIFLKHLGRVPSNEDLAVAAGRHFEELQEKDAWLAAPSERPILPLGPKTARSIAYAVDNTPFWLTPHKNIGLKYLFGPKQSQWFDYEMSPAPLETIAYGIRYEPIERRLADPKVRAWLQEGFEHLKRNLHPASKATPPPIKAVAYRLENANFSTLQERVVNDVARAKRTPHAQVLSESQLFHDHTSDGLVMSQILGMFLGGFIPGIVALTASDDPGIGAGVGAVSSQLTAWGLRTLTPKGWGITSRTEPFTPRLLSTSHDAEPFFSSGTPLSYGLVAGDGMNLLLSRSSTPSDSYMNILAWFPRDSHYSALIAGSSAEPSIRLQTEKAPAPEVIAGPTEQRKEFKPDSVLQEARDRLARWQSPLITTVSDEVFQAALKVNQLREEARRQVLERDDLIDSLLTALIAREHLLVFGPSGNAKTTTIKAVLAAFRDAAGNRSFSKQAMKHDTGEAELFGPFSPSKLLNEDKYERLVAQSFLKFRHVILDEIFDLRPSSRRDLLEPLEERSYSHAGRTYPGDIETAVGITNKFIPEVLLRPNGELDDSARALVDRFALFYYLGWEFQQMKSDMDLLGRSRKDIELTPIQFDDKQKLIDFAKGLPLPESVRYGGNLLWQKMRDRLEPAEHQAVAAWNQSRFEGRVSDPPYRTTRVFSPRGKQMSGTILRAATVLNWLKTGSNQMPRLTLESLIEQQRSVTAMDSNDEMLQRRLNATSNPFERVQLQGILRERSAFKDELSKFENTVASHPLTARMKELERRTKNEAPPEERLRMVHDVLELIEDAEDQRADLTKQISEQGYESAAAYQAVERGHEMLAGLLQGEKTQ